MFTRKRLIRNSKRKHNILNQKSTHSVIIVKEHDTYASLPPLRIREARIRAKV